MIDWMIGNVSACSLIPFLVQCADIADGMQQKVGLVEFVHCCCCMYVVSKYLQKVCRIG